MSSPLGIGVIGSGFNARFHIQAFMAVRDAEVRGIYSPTRANADSSTRSNSETTLSRSLKVGTMIASCGELQICCTGEDFGSSSIVNSLSDFLGCPNYNGQRKIRKRRVRSVPGINSSTRAP